MSNNKLPNINVKLGDLSGLYAVPGKYLQPDGSWITYDQKIAKYANIINQNLIVDEPEPVVETYCLKKSDKGEEVKKLQKYLNSVGFSLVVDGDFGPKTEGAVKAYQKNKGLEETGIVTEAVKKAMNDFVIVEPEKLDIIVQMGHIGRTTGATGAYREQEFTQALGDAMEPLLKASGLNYRIMGADDWKKPEPNKATIFLSIHYDGSKNKNARGYSLGYKPDSNPEFKEALAVSYGKLCGFKRRKDNYTAGLRLYYAWRDDLKRKPHVVADYYALLEAGFGTNDIERNWMFANINEIASHHVDLIVRFLNEEQKT